MTVQELIDQLNNVEDKNIEVRYMDKRYDDNIFFEAMDVPKGVSRLAPNEICYRARRVEEVDMATDSHSLASKKIIFIY